MFPTLEDLRPTTKIGRELVAALRRGDTTWVAHQEIDQAVTIPPLGTALLSTLILLYGPPDNAIAVFADGQQDLELQPLFGPKWKGITLTDEAALLLLNPHPEARAHALREHHWLGILDVNTNEGNVEIDDLAAITQCLWLGNDFDKAPPREATALLNHNIETIQYLAAAVQKEGNLPKSTNGKALALFLIPSVEVSDWEPCLFHKDPRLIPLYPIISRCIDAELAGDNRPEYKPEVGKALTHWLTSYAQSFIKHQAPTKTTRR